MNSHRIGVVIVTYNSADLLAGLLESLPDGIGKNLTWTVAVADNDSADGSAAAARALAPEALVIDMGRNAGYAAGINAAVAALGRMDAYLILNPDVRLAPGCVPALLQTLTRGRVGIAVPRLTDARGELILSMRREPSVLRQLGDAVLGAERAGRWKLLGEVVSSVKSYESKSLTDWAEGSTQLISGECWQLAGEWDERFFLYSEEAEYNLRARDHGLLTVYTPSASAIHLEGGSAANPELWALLQANRIRLYALRNGRAKLALFWAASVLREASRSLMGKQTSRRALMTLLNPKRMSAKPGPEFIR